MQKVFLGALYPRERSFSLLPWVASPLVQESIDVYGKCFKVDPSRTFDIKWEPYDEDEKHNQIYYCEYNDFRDGLSDFFNTYVKDGILLLFTNCKLKRDTLDKGYRSGFASGECPVVIVHNRYSVQYVQQITIHEFGEVLDLGHCGSVECVMNGDLKAGSPIIFCKRHEEQIKKLGK